MQQCKGRLAKGMSTRHHWSIRIVEYCQLRCQLEIACTRCQRASGLCRCNGATKPTATTNFKVSPGAFGFCPEDGSCSHCSTLVPAQVFLRANSLRHRAASQPSEQERARVNVPAIMRIFTFGLACNTSNFGFSRYWNTMASLPSQHRISQKRIKNGTLPESPDQVRGGARASCTSESIQHW